MRSLPAFSLLALASVAAAQTCYEPNFGTSIGAGDDVVLSGGSLGFSFPFNGQMYTDIYVGTNGFIYLANASTPVPTAGLCCAGSTANLVAALNPMIAVFWDDLNVIAANGSAVYVNTSAAGCVVTWDKVVQYSNTVQFDIQAQLLPTGEIKFTYGGDTQIRVAGDVLVGVSEGNGAVVPAASDFSTAGVTGANTAFEMFNAAGSFDLPGQSLSLLPATASWAHVPTGCRGAAVKYGTGCINQADSFYEYFGTAGAFDLGMSGFTMINTSTGYLALPATSAYVAPSTAALPLTLTDDSETAVTLSSPLMVAGVPYSSLTVCSNGFVSVATGNGTAYTPNVANFLSGAQTSFRAWHDYNPAVAGSGQVKFEEVAGVAYITWDGVFDYGTTGPGSTLQFQFELATGNVTILFQSMSLLGNGHLVGYSVGGPSNDGGSVDLSVALPTSLTVSNTQIVPLTLNAVGSPGFGATVSLDTSEIPAGTIFGAVLMGLLEFNPGIDLTAFGMAGCYQYNDGSSSLMFLAPPSTVPTLFSVPAAPALFGVTIAAQSAVFAPGTTLLGAITSNGVRMTLGY